MFLFAKTVYNKSSLRRTGTNEMKKGINKEQLANISDTATVMFRFKTAGGIVTGKVFKDMVQNGLKFDQNLYWAVSA